MGRARLFDSFTSLLLSSAPLASPYLLCSSSPLCALSPLPLWFHERHLCFVSAGSRVKLFQHFLKPVNWWGQPPGGGLRGGGGGFGAHWSIQRPFGHWLDHGAGVNGFPVVHLEVHARPRSGQTSSGLTSGWPTRFGGARMVSALFCGPGGGQGVKGRGRACGSGLVFWMGRIRAWSRPVPGPAPAPGSFARALRVRGGGQTDGQSQMRLCAEIGLSPALLPLLFFPGSVSCWA